MDLSRRVLEFSNTCGGGEFNGCDGRNRPFLDDTLECVSESIMLQKTQTATLSSSSPFSFSSSFFVVFVVFIPMADRGVVYMYVLETFGGFGGFVATGIGRFEHVRRR